MDMETLTGKSPEVTFIDFLDGIAQTMQCNRGCARWEWAGYSRQLSDEARRSIEAGGTDAGIDMANEMMRIDQ